MYGGSGGVALPQNMLGGGHHGMIFRQGQWIDGATGMRVSPQEYMRRMTANDPYGAMRDRTESLNQGLTAARMGLMERAGGMIDRAGRGGGNMRAAGGPGAAMPGRINLEALFSALGTGGSTGVPGATGVPGLPVRMSDLKGPPRFNAPQGVGPMAAIPAFAGMGAENPPMPGMMPAPPWPPGRGLAPPRGMPRRGGFTRRPPPGVGLIGPPVRAY